MRLQGALCLAFATAVLTATPAPLAAQESDDDFATDDDQAPPPGDNDTTGEDDEGDTFDMPADEPPPPVEQAVDSENPDAPDSAAEPPPEEQIEEEIGEYPVREVLRPLTLPQYMAEVSLQLVVGGETIPGTTGDNRFNSSAVIAGAFGVTREAQVGLHYGLGSLAKDSNDNLTFFEGKAVSLDFMYSFKKWVAAQVSVPILLDPFSLGVVLGAPLRFTLFEKLALRFGENFLAFKLHRFVPPVDNPATADALVQSDARGDVDIDGEINLLFQVQWQHSDHMVFDGRYGVRAVDFEFQDAPNLLDFGLTYSPSNKLDFGARIGFSNLSQGVKTFGVTGVAAFRL